MASAVGAAVREAGRGRGQRDDAMVTARVDRALKSRGIAALKELGSTPTELANRRSNTLPKQASCLRPRLPQVAAPAFVGSRLP